MQREALAGLPAVERIAVVAQQDQQLGVAEAVDETTGAEKPRSSDGTGRLVDADEGEERLRASSSTSTRDVAAAASGSSSRRSGSVAPVAADQADRDGITNGSLRRLAGRRRQLCVERRACRCATARRSGRARSRAACPPAQYQRLNCGSRRASSLPGWRRRSPARSRRR